MVQGGMLALFAGVQNRTHGVEPFDILATVGGADTSQVIITGSNHTCR